MQGKGEHFGQVQGLTVAELGHLLSATETVGRHDGLLMSVSIPQNTTVVGYGPPTSRTPEAPMWTI